MYAGSSYAAAAYAGDNPATISTPSIPGNGHIVDFSTSGSYIRDEGGDCGGSIGDFTTSTGSVSDQ